MNWKKNLNNRTKTILKVDAGFKQSIYKLLKSPASESINFIKFKWPNCTFKYTYYLGKKYAEQNSFNEAIVCFKSIILFADDCKELLIDFALVLYEIGEFKESAGYAELLYASDPDDVDIYKFYLDCLLMTKQPQKIFSVCDSLKCIDFDILYFKSQAFRLIGNINSSIEILKTLQEKNSDFFYKFALADAYGETDSLKSIEIYENIISKGISLSNVQNYNLSLHYLRAQKFELGWKLFEYGLDKDTGVYGRKLPYNFKNTFRADKHEIDDFKWIMICSEQGIGDQILFLSALSDALKDFPKIFFFGEKRIFPLLKRSYPSLIVSNNGIIDDINLFSLKDKDSFGYIPLGTLLSRYRPNIQSYLNNKRAYILFDQGMYSEFRTYLTSISKGRRIIGISWNSNVSKDLFSIKNIDFIDWLPIFTKDTLVVNLQYGDTAEQQTILNNLGLEMISFNNFDFTKELDVWLALSAACDGIVSVSTSLVHFAGSCGQHVSVVMPNSQGHWSLGLNEFESLYYPNVRIFRKDKWQSNTSLIISAASVIQ